MTNLRTLALLLPLFLLAACGSEAGAAGNVGSAAESLTKVLSGITDAKSAEAAKTQLGSLTEKLTGALGSLTSGAESTGTEAKNALGGLAEKAKGAVSALTPELTKKFGGITEQITRLMGNAEITKVIGPMLEKLKGVIPS